MTDMKGKTALKVLGLKEWPSSFQDVRHVYKQKCFELHPDKNPDPSAVEPFKLLAPALEFFKLHFTGSAEEIIFDREEHEREEQEHIRRERELILENLERERETMKKQEHDAKHEKEELDSNIEFLLKKLRDTEKLKQEAMRRQKNLANDLRALDEKIKYERAQQVQEHSDIQLFLRIINHLKIKHGNLRSYLYYKVKKDLCNFYSRDKCKHTVSYKCQNTGWSFNSCTFKHGDDDTLVDLGEFENQQVVFDKSSFTFYFTHTGTNEFVRMHISKFEF
jgi:hypothetical protein